MLVLSRGPKDKIVFPNLGVSVEILRVSGNRVRVGVDAPKDVRVLRHEIAGSLNAELNQEADQAHGPKLSHRLRNRLNVAHVALGLAEKQLNAGLSDEALATLHRAIREFDTIDGELHPADGAATAPAPKSLQPRALLVEDDVNESELLAGFLRLSGFVVDTAGDGLQAMVQLARHDRPDVVLLDMHMPRMNGAKTVGSIRRNPDYRHVRLYAVSGSTPSEVNVEVGPQGVDRWFQKPIKPQELVDCLQQELQIAHTAV
jgi:carbon storage regulator CsrA